MAWLRLILLLCGALFIGLLVWWERRRPRQAQNGGGARTGRSEPSFDMGPGADPGPEQGDRGEGPAQASAAGQGLRPAHALGGGFVVDQAPPEARARDRELRRPPPVIDWSDAEITVGSDPPMTGEQQPIPAPLADLPPLVVAWPPEAERRIVTLRILPARQDRLAGRALRQGLAGCGFRHGPFGIFHLPEADGRVVLSAASLVRPGILDPENMDFQRFAGINLFAVLPGPLPAELALNRLAAVAAELADRIAGRVQDESGAPFNGARLAEWRQRCLASMSSDYHASAATASGAAASGATGGAGVDGASEAAAGQAD